MNSGKRITQSGRDITAAIAVLALLSGCASLPSLENARTVSLRTNFSSHGGLAVDVDGNPNTSPGRMAAEGFAMTEGCGALFLACAVVTVPLGAATGAVITAVETLPEEQAHELNRVSASAMAGFNLNGRFSKAVREEASRQGVVLSKGLAPSGGRADARLDIVMTKFRWVVSVGNNVAIRINFKVTGFADGKRGCRNITYTGERAKVPEWTADSGKRIHQELTTIMDEASHTIWQKVLDRGG